jgi:hypothetical protein
LELAARKKAWIARPAPDRQTRRERYQALRALTEQLRPHLAAREHQVRKELERSRGQLEANAVLRRRDYSFCLFPEEVIRPFCTQFL